MANVNAPFGLRPKKSIGRANTAVNEYAHDSGYATALFTGDPVVSTGTSTTGQAGIQDGTPIVQASGTITTTAIRGVVDGVRPTYTNLTLQYAPASVECAILVCDDPGQIFEIMSNGTVVVGDISSTVGITSGAGSTNSGTSAYVLTESDVGQSSHVLHVLRLSPISGNALGANAIVDVRINLHEMGSTATGT